MTSIPQQTNRYIPLQLISKELKEMVIPKDTLLWDWNEQPDALYFIESGILKARYAFPQDDYEISEAMLAGTIAGELTFLAQQPRDTMAKTQALDVIKLLQSKSIIPIERAQMRICATMPAKEGKRLKDKFIAMFTKIEEEDWSDVWEVVGTIDPGSLRQINVLFENEVKGEGGVETLAFSTVDQGDDEEGEDW